VLREQTRRVEVYQFSNGDTFNVTRRSGNAAGDAKVSTRLFKEFMTERKQGERAIRKGLLHPTPTMEAVPAPPPVNGGTTANGGSAVLTSVLFLPVDAPAEVSIKDKLEEAIRVAQEEQDRLFSLTQAAEKRVQLLKALIPFQDDESFSLTLSALLPPPPQPPPPVAPPVLEPAAIRPQIQVTRNRVEELVLAISGDFTAPDIVGKIVGAADIDAVERRRVYTAVNGALAGLHERGKVDKVTQGIGRRNTVWRALTAISPDVDLEYRQELVDANI
jgi:hypothetical protein